MIREVENLQDVGSCSTRPAKSKAYIVTVQITTSRSIGHVIGGLRNEKC